MSMSLNSPLQRDIELEKIEIQELSQMKFPHTIYKPFSLICCGASEKKFAIIGTAAFCTLLQPIFVPQSMHNEFSFTIEELNAPTTKATEHIIDKFDLKTIYYNCNVLERQSITLDPLYASEFGEQPLKTQINIVSYLEKDDFKRPIIAVITNHGVCEIRTKIPLKRFWDKTLVKANELWPKIFDHSSLSHNSDFATINNYVNDVNITTCCWSAILDQANSCNLYCCTASGWIVTLKFEQPDTAKCIAKFKTGLSAISTIKSFRMQESKKTEEFLIVSDRHGVIKVFGVEEGNLKELETLWSKCDNMHCQQFIVQILDKDGLIVIITSKAAHLLVFLLDSKGTLLNKTTRYVGGIQITGLAAYTPYEYIVATLSGYIEHVTLTFIKQKIEMNAVQLQHNMDCTNYHILGLFLTSNKAACIFALYPTNFIDSKEKSLCLLSVCILNKKYALNVLEKLDSLNIEEHADCAEVIRTTFLGNLEHQYFLDYNPEPVQINEGFLHRLRIRLIIVQSSLLFTRLRQKQHGETYRQEIASICSTIKAILICKRLTNMLSLTSLSEFQKLSGMCLRRALLCYLKGDLNKQYASIRDIFIPIMEPLIERAEKLFEGKKEKCLYCVETINVETGMCESKHKMSRCCISYVQIPLLSGNRFCKHCKQVSLEYEGLLKEVLVPNEKIQCPFCNCSLVDVSQLLSTE